jgi:two-component system cell cycle response regulator DivK
LSNGFHGGKKKVLKPAGPCTDKEDIMFKIALVEDNRVLRTAQEGLLKRAGYLVVHAADGEEALRVVKSEQPDVVLLDLMLPKLSGPEVLRWLKGDSATAHIPIIVVTGLSLKNEQKLRDEGAAAFFEKNALLSAPEPLLRTIEEVLRQAQKPVPPPIKVEAVIQRMLN